MASYTTNLNLKKPAGSENVAIGDINNNMDTIDQAYGTLSDQIGNISFVNEDISSGSNKDINIGNLKKFLLIILGNAGAMYFGRTTSDGSLNLYKVSDSSYGTGITVTNGTGKVNVAWSGSGTLSAKVMYI